MKQVITEDDSVTFYNEKYGETYHSVSGAVEEAVKKFVKPCRIAERKEVKILDFCFGLGYNSGCALDAAPGKVFIVGLENDKEIIKKILELDPPIKNYDIIKKAAEKLEYKDDKVEIKLIIGDALQEVKKLDLEFDAVFFDPFSPKKHPEMWSLDVFKDIYKVMKKGGILTTYSCAAKVREALKAANFKVMDGPSVGRKAPSTIAEKKALS